MDGLIRRGELQQALRLLGVLDLLPVHAVELHALVRLGELDAALRREQVLEQLHVQHHAAHLDVRRRTRRHQ